MPRVRDKLQPCLMEDESGHTFTKFAVSTTFAGCLSVLQSVVPREFSMAVQI